MVLVLVLVAWFDLAVLDCMKNNTGFMHSIFLINLRNHSSIITNHRHNQSSS